MDVLRMYVIRIYIRTYVPVPVCMYVPVYVCMYICTYTCIYVCTCVCMYVRLLLLLLLYCTVPHCTAPYRCTCTGSLTHALTHSPTPSFTHNSLTSNITRRKY